jgi:hypothetical protein
MATEHDALAKLATEFWRLLKITEKALAEVPTEKAAGAAAQLRYSGSRLATICNEAGLRLVAYDGEPYEANLPVTVANADAAAEFEAAVVDRTIEPTIMAAGQVVAMGKVILKERK